MVASERFNGYLIGGEPHLLASGENMLGRALLLACLLAVGARAQYCDLINYDVFAQDSGSGYRGTYLGAILTSATDPYSILNTVGKYGSNISATSIWNTVGQYGSSVGTYSAFNSLSSNPPVILGYTASTGTYYLVAYLTTNTLKYPAVDPRDLHGVLKYGGCAGCMPRVNYDTVRIAVHDTTVKRDTLVQKDTVRISRVDTLLRLDTLRFRDTVKVAVHDTVPNCPAAIRGGTRNHEGGSMPAFTIAGRAVGLCRE